VRSVALIDMIRESLGVPLKEKKQKSNVSSDYRDEFDRCYSNTFLFFLPTCLWKHGGMCKNDK
jgi:hypothetical protein